MRGQVTHARLAALERVAGAARGLEPMLGHAHNEEWDSAVDQIRAALAALSGPAKPEKKSPDALTSGPVQAGREVAEDYRPPAEPSIAPSPPPGTPRRSIADDVITETIRRHTAILEENREENQRIIGESMNPGTPRAPREPWRVGRKVGRTLYLHDKIVGLLDAPGLALQAAQALNAYWEKHVAAPAPAAREPPDAGGYEDPPIKCGTFGAHIPADVRARMDADRAAAEAAQRTPAPAAAPQGDPLAKIATLHDDYCYAVKQQISAAMTAPAALEARLRQLVDQFRQRALDAEPFSERRKAFDSCASDLERALNEVTK